MIVFESQKIRRIVGRLERGEALQASLKRLAQEKGITASWLSALGAFEWVELMEYDQHAQKYKAPKRIEECEILHLTGNLSFRKGENFAHVHASVSKEVGDRIEVYGGHLVDAQVFACELMIECLDDVVLQREYDEATGLDLWKGDCLAAPESMVDEVEDRATNPPKKVAAPAAESLSWSQVAAVAQAAGNDSAAAAPRLEQMPKTGDYVQHKTFGLCRVEGRGVDGALIIRLHNDPRRRKISVDHVEFIGPKQDGDKRVFVLRKRG